MFSSMKNFLAAGPICITVGWLLHAALPTPRLSSSQAGVLFVLLAVMLAAFTF
jgi:hypothetical protein